MTGASLPEVAASLAGHVDALGGALARWSARDESKPHAPARRAASEAVGAIDAMLAELHAARSRLVAEIRQSDDAAMASSADLLAELQHGSGGAR